MIIAGKYEVISELGRGGMGVVYKVRHLELGSIFALKVLRFNLTEEATAAVGRFYHEAQIMAQIRHPHIVQVFDIGKDENCHYFVMEYIQGRSLDEILKQEGHLPLPKVVAISTQIGQALAYAHTHQPLVVHRDIKPHNIMIEDGTGRVVVMDFGIAKLLDQQQTQYTGTGVFIGTLAYGAPEQMRSGMMLDGRADIFSLGLVIRNGHRPPLLCGTVPRGNHRQTTLRTWRLSSGVRTPATARFPAADHQSYREKPGPALWYGHGIARCAGQSPCSRAGWQAGMGVTAWRRLPGCAGCYRVDLGMALA